MPVTPGFPPPAGTGSARVIAPPPVLFITSWIAASVLHRRVPLRLVRSRRKARLSLGGAAIAAGTCLSAAVVRRFARASTPVSPLRATCALVIDGPYRYTRNPDYLGQTLIYTGSAIIANRVWPLALLPVVLLLVNRGVIEREERYLQRLFGSAYRNYLERVPRWL